MQDNNSTWEATKQRLQARWPALSEADLEPTEGRREELVGLLEGRLGYAKANAERDVDQFLRGDLIVPRDVADEDTHTGTTGPAPQLNGQASSADAFRTTGGYDYSQTARPSSYGYESGEPGGYRYGQTVGSDNFGGKVDTSSRGWLGSMATLPWRTTALVAAVGTGGLALVSMMLANRRARRKQIVIPLPTQAESVQAVEAAGRAAGSGWRLIRSFAMLAAGGIAGWSARRYHAMS